MIVSTYRQSDRYSAAVAGGAVICYQVPRSVAAQKIADVVGSLKLAEKLLSEPVSAAEWRATWASALTHDLASVGDDIATIVDRERADAIEARLNVALEMLGEHSARNPWHDLLADDHHNQFSELLKDFFIGT